MRSSPSVHDVGIVCTERLFLVSCKPVATHEPLVLVGTAAEADLAEAPHGGRGLLMLPPTLLLHQVCLQ